MNRHNGFTPQQVFSIGAFLLVFLFLFFQVSSVSVSAVGFEVVSSEMPASSPDWGWMQESLKDSGQPAILVLTDQQQDDLSALRHNSDIFLYGLFPVTVSLLLLVWFARWFYHTFLDSWL